MFPVCIRNKWKHDKNMCSPDGGSLNSACLSVSPYTRYFFFLFSQNHAGTQLNTCPSNKVTAFLHVCIHLFVLFTSFYVCIWSFITLYVSGIKRNHGTESQSLWTDLRPTGPSISLKFTDLRDNTHIDISIIRFSRLARL